jgi:hypothetical protein
MTEREPGYYWVRWGTRDWEPAKWQTKDRGWTFCGHNGEYCSDYYWTEIGERIAIPTERLNTAAPLLLEATKMLLQLVEDMMPGIRYIALPNYKLLNDALGKGKRALVVAGDVENKH